MDCFRGSVRPNLEINLNVMDGRIEKNRSYVNKSYRFDMILM